MGLTLYLDLMSQPSRAVLLFCLENAIPHTVSLVQIAKGQNKTPEFGAKNPNKKLPTIEDDGFVVYESHTILRYLAQTRGVSDNWYPSDIKARTKIDMYLDWHHTNLRPGAAGSVFAGFLGAKMGMPPAALETKKVESAKTLHTSLKLMNEWLSQTAYIASDKISIADLLASNEISMMRLINYDLTPYPRVDAWMKKMATLKHWNEVHSVINKITAANAAKSKL